MQVKEGVIPTALGTIVTTTGFVAKNLVPASVAGGIIGFGLAHIVLGTIDLVEHRDNSRQNEIYQQ